MKSLILLPLLFFLFACGDQPDKDRIIGTWKYKEVSETNKLYVTSDPAKQRELIEKEIKNVSPAELGMERADYIKYRTKRMKQESAGGYVFTDDFFFQVTHYGGTLPRKYKVDEKKKVFTWIHNGKKSDEKSSYKYTFDGDDLILKTQDVKIVLTRK